MKQIAMLIVAIVLLGFAALTVYYTRTETGVVDETETPAELPANPSPNLLPPDAPKASVPPPAHGKEGELDMSAKGVRTYTPLPKPSFFATDGLPSETLPINPLDFQPVTTALTDPLKELIAELEKNPKHLATYQRTILFLCRSGRPNEAIPYFERYLAAGGALKDLGEIVVSENGKAAPGEPLGGGLEFYIRGLAMIGRFKDANEKQKQLEEQLPGFAESGMSAVFLRFYEFFQEVAVKKSAYDAMISLEKFNSIWPIGRYPEFESQAATAFIGILTETNVEELRPLLPRLDQVWPHLPPQTMQLIGQDVLKRGLQPSPLLLSSSDPVLKNEACNPAALIRRSLHSRTRAHDLETARRQAQRAVQLARELQLPDLEMAALWNLADVAHAAKDLNTEIQTIQEAQKLGQSAPKEGFQLQTSLRVAALHEQLADEQKAMETYQAVFKQAKTRGASLTALRAMRGYTRLAARFLKTEDSEQMLKTQADGFERAQAVPRLLAEPNLDLGLCYQRQKRVNEAAACYSKVLQAQDPEWSMQAYLAIGDLCLADPNGGAEAEKAFSTVQDIEREARNAEMRWRAFLGLARSRLAQMDTAGARRHIEAALSVIEAQSPSVVDYQQRRVLQDDTQAVWQLALDLALKEGDGNGAFALGERCRARAMQDVMGSKKFTAPAVTLDELKAVLGTTKAVLYLDLPETLLIWIVSANDVSFERVAASQPKVYGDAVAVMRAASAAKSGGITWKHTMGKGYDRLWKPVSKYVKDGERVCIVPHGMLHYVPFAALHDGSAFLAEKNEVFTAPSAAALVDARKRGSGSLASPVLFDPLFSTDLKSTYTTTESARVAELFPGAKLFKGREGSASSLLALAADTGLLHISAHAQFDPWQPARSAFEVWRDGKPGLFTLEEIATLRLPNAQLVAFNTTPTGFAQTAGGDDAAATVRAFQMTGARNVLTALWTIDHGQRMKLLTSFYSNLKNNPDPVSALTAAQRAWLKENPHPYVWAAFQISGAGK